MRRYPRGYSGEEHLTIGSDLLAVLRILKLPEQVLGSEQAARLARVDPDGWYPIDWLLELMEMLEQQVGPYALMRMGRTLFQLSHKQRVMAVARSAKDILYGIDGMYHHANRGRGIGGWKVIKFEPGMAELEKNTPHHCLMEQGILTEALMTIGCPCNVAQRACFREGAPNCIFTVTSVLIDERWHGAGPKPRA
jgi:hypothetical protein